MILATRVSQSGHGNQVEPGSSDGLKALRLFSSPLLKSVYTQTQSLEYHSLGYLQTVLTR